MVVLVYSVGELMFGSISLTCCAVLFRSCSSMYNYTDILFDQYMFTLPGACLKGYKYCFGLCVHVTVCDLNSSSMYIRMYSCEKCQTLDNCYIYMDRS